MSKLLEAQRLHALHYLRVLRTVNERAKKDFSLAQKELDRDWGQVEHALGWAVSHSNKDRLAALFSSAFPGLAPRLLELRQHPQERIRSLEATLVAIQQLKETRGSYSEWHEFEKFLDVLGVGPVEKVSDPGLPFGEGGITPIAILEVNRLTSLGEAYRQLGKSQQSREFQQQALSIARSVGYRGGEGVALSNLGNISLQLGESIQAAEYLQQALDISREVGDRYREAVNLGNLGVAYKQLKRYTEAIRCHQQSWTISRELGDRQLEGSQLGGLGEVYRLAGQHDMGIDHLGQALIIAREIGDKRSEGNRLGNLGSAYAELGRYSEALEQFQQALAIAREIGDRRGEGNRLGNLGRVHSLMREYQLAESYLQQALVISEEIGDSRLRQNTLSNLAEIGYAHLAAQPVAADADSGKGVGRVAWGSNVGPDVWLERMVKAAEEDPTIVHKLRTILKLEDQIVSIMSTSLNPQIMKVFEQHGILVGQLAVQVGAADSQEDFQEFVNWLDDNVEGILKELENKEPSHPSKILSYLAIGLGTYLGYQSNGLIGAVVGFFIGNVLGGFIAVLLFPIVAVRGRSASAREILRAAIATLWISDLLFLAGVFLLRDNLVLSSPQGTSLLILGAALGVLTIVAIIRRLQLKAGLFD